MKWFTIEKIRNAIPAEFSFNPKRWKAAKKENVRHFLSFCFYSIFPPPILMYWFYSMKHEEYWNRQVTIRWVLRSLVQIVITSSFYERSPIFQRKKIRDMCITNCCWYWLVIVELIICTTITSQLIHRSSFSYQKFTWQVKLVDLFRFVYCLSFGYT